MSPMRRSKHDGSACFVITAGGDSTTPRNFILEGAPNVQLQWIANCRLTLRIGFADYRAKQALRSQPLNIVLGV